jgi:hypothetical protein
MTNALAYFFQIVIDKFSKVVVFDFRQIWTNIFLNASAIAIHGPMLQKFSAQNFTTAKMFVPGKPFQPSLMFVGEAGAFLCEAYFMYFPLGRILACRRQIL